MRIQNKIMLYSVGTLVLLAITIGVAFKYQMEQLKIEQDRIVKEAYYANKKQELKNYIDLAKDAIQHLLNSDDEIEAQKQAKQILTGLRYGKSDGDGDEQEQAGYFFGYTLEGIPIIHPIKTDWVDKGETKIDYYVCQTNWDEEGCDENDKIYVIHKLIEEAKTRAENGFFEYPFVYPLLKVQRPKLSYVEILAPWNWMLGTGVYVDEIDVILRNTEKENEIYLEKLLLLIAITTIFGLIIIGGVQYRLGQIIVSSRITSDLHSGVCYKLYETIDFISANKQKPSRSALEEIQEKIWSVSEELWSLMDKKSDSSRLANRLRTLATEFSIMNHLPVNFTSTGDIKGVAWDKEDELYNLAQEALLNIKKHSEATKIEITLKGKKDQIELCVKDDGIGFDISTVNQEGGLKYMRMCIQKAGGTFDIKTSSEGTMVVATTCKF